MLCLALLFVPGLMAFSAAPKGKPAPSLNDPGLAAYFKSEVDTLSARCLADIKSLGDWESRRGEYRRQLQEMLGLWPEPERTDLKAVITGKLEEADFTVEKLQFQAMPRLYVTASLYLPKQVEWPAPAILYACGHSRVVTNGISYGAKANYQHHGIWFARNGYVCLTIDTVQLGELEGSHRGTHTEGKWWWNSRGYTPAGVETWFGIRALDYLCSRPEVDKERIGMTGRSGGGSYTWTVAALDERVKVAVPVAGITDLRNQVLDGCVEGHCDCMFFQNLYRWDFPLVAALVAPRPLLIGNSDKDKIFPLDGVVRLYNQAMRIYRLYNETNHLGLLITEGPHQDTQDLQLPAFRWFNRFLKGEDAVIEMAARKRFSPRQLQVFDKLPGDEMNTSIEQSFIPTGVVTNRAEYLRALREKVFNGWPTEPCRAKATLKGTHQVEGLSVSTYVLQPQPGVDLSLRVVQDPKVERPGKILLTVLDNVDWTNAPAKFLWLGNPTPEAVTRLREDLQARKLAIAYLVPRCVEPTPWQADVKKASQVRRRYMLLGQTLDGMRVWDIRCAAEAVKALPEFAKLPLYVKAKRQMGVNAVYAALFEPEIQKLKLEDLPSSHRQGPDYLGVLKIGDIPQALALIGSRAEMSGP